jgi:hypothetical protein
VEKSKKDKIMKDMEEQQKLNGVYNTPLGFIARDIMREVLDEEEKEDKSNLNKKE